VGELVEVAFVGDEFQGGMIQALLEEHGIRSLLQQVTPSGPQVGYGLMNPGGGARRVMVHAENSDRARSLIEATMAEQEDFPEPVNAEYLDEAAAGRKPRSYGLIGGYARAIFWSILAMVVFFGVFVLLRALGLT
jgi:Putative prokaryotic signal transducing protein